MKINKNDSRRTVLTLAVVCLAAYFIFKLSGFAIASAVLLFAALIGGKTSCFIALYWERFALLLGSFNAKLILILAFYIFLTPLALLYRLFCRKTSKHFCVNDKDTLFENAHRHYDKDTFKKLW